MNILLVEDNKGDAVLIREYLAESLIDITFNLNHAERLSEAMEELNKGSFNIILLDLGLPDSYGLDTFRKLNKNSPDIPVIILTGLDDEESSMKSVKEGAQDYLVKGNINSYLLRKSIKYAIERKKTTAQMEVISRFPSENPNPVIRLSSDCVLMYANHAANELLDVCGCALGQIAPPFMCEIVIGSLKYDEVNRVEKQIGERTWLMNIVPINEANYVNIYFINITNLKESEKIIQKTNERLSYALKASNAGSWDWDMKNDIMIWSNEFLEVFGMEPDTIPGFKSWKKALHPEDIDNALQRIQEAVDNMNDLISDYRIILPNKEIRWIRDTGRTFYKNGIPIRMSGICMDITDSKKAEEVITNRNNELENFYKIAISREMRSIELKKKINQLSIQLGMPAPYKLDYLDEKNKLSQNNGGNI